MAHGTGYCYAKSHLLAALPRANGVPAALCYQRLSIADQGGPFCLHGLNAVHLRDHGWYRVDARGNKPGVDAQFEPPVERLAFPLRFDGERDLPERCVEPLACVLEVLQRAKTYLDVLNDLPDAVEPSDRLDELPEGSEDPLPERRKRHAGTAEVRRARDHQLEPFLPPKAP